MKYGPFTPRPGDLFTWHYNDNDKQCVADLWIIGGYVPTVEVNLLIALAGRFIWWVQNGNLLFRVIVQPVQTSAEPYLRKIHPRIKL